MGGSTSKPGNYKHNKSSYSRDNHRHQGPGYTSNGRSTSPSWSQAHMVSTRPAPRSNLNVNRVVDSALGSGGGNNRHGNSSSSHQYHAKSAAAHHQLLATTATNKPQQVMVQQVVVVNQQQQQQHHRAPKSNNRTTKGSNKPKLDYSNVECGVCGHTGHSTERCHHRGSTCFICHQPGHLRSVCTAKVHHKDSRYKPGGGNHR